jgi:hypothetical protein
LNKNFLIKNFFVLFVVTFICTFIFNEHSSYAVADPDNCMMCHDHPGIVRMNEKGIKRDFYIEEDIFIPRSVHGNVRCVDCHDYIMEGNEPKVPHQPLIKEKVRCNLVCHSIIEPSRADDPSDKKYFSHENAYVAYKESAHGIADRELPQDKQDPDAPYCTYCHDINPIYEKVGSEITPINDPQLKRCRGCHKDDFAARFYRHTKHRFDMKTNRTKYQVVQLCVECHGNNDMMSRHKLSAAPVKEYKNTFHYKMVYHGGERWAGCTDCHTKANYPMDPNRPSGGDAGIHELLSKKNPKATVFITEEKRFDAEKDNLVKTCSVDVCHPKAKDSKSFARSVGHIAPHNFLGLFILEEAFFWLCYGTLSFVLTLITLDLVRKILG